MFSNIYLDAFLVGILGVFLLSHYKRKFAQSPLVKVFDLGISVCAIVSMSLVDYLGIVYFHWSKEHWFFKVTETLTCLLITIFALSLTDLFLWQIIYERRNGAAPPQILKASVGTIIAFGMLVIVIHYVFHYEVSALLATSGVVAMVLGFALQTTMSNVFSGLILNAEKPFQIGDWVAIGTFPPGNVIDVNWRSTKIMTRNGTAISLPNSTTATVNIEILQDKEAFSACTIEVCLDPTHHPQKIKSILTNAAMTLGEKLKTFSVNFLGVRPEGAVYGVSIRYKNFRDEVATKDRLWTEIWLHLSAEGIGLLTQLSEIRLLPRVVAHKTQDDVMRIFSNLDLFHGIPEEDLRQLSQSGTLREFDEGETIFKQGDEGRSMFVIMEGVVGVFVEQDQVLKEVGCLGAWSYFGEMALLTGELRTATVRASTFVVMIEIAKGSMEPLIKKNLKIASVLAKQITHRRKGLHSTSNLKSDTLATESLFKSIVKYFAS